MSLVRIDEKIPSGLWSPPRVVLTWQRLAEMERRILGRAATLCSNLALGGLSSLVLAISIFCCWRGAAAAVAAAARAER